jgi:REP element-mobilizing transposase RayT
MARQLRIEYEGAFYHITSRGNERTKIFEDRDDKEKFLEYLLESINKYNVVVYSYVLMDNHYHLLVETKE